MHTRIMRNAVSSASLALALFAATPLLAQGASPGPNAPESATPSPVLDTGAAQDEIVVTGTTRAERKLDTSLSISSVTSATIQQINPQSAADLIRFIPGIRSEASGGEG